MVGAPDVFRTPEKIADQSPHISGTSLFTISDGKEGIDSTFSMASINSDLPSIPPDKRIANGDAEKQPLSGVSRAHEMGTANACLVFYLWQMQEIILKIYSAPDNESVYRAVTKFIENILRKLNPNGQESGPWIVTQSILQLRKEEAWFTTLCQVAVPFFIAGCGTIGAGLVLGTVRDWEVFVQVSAIFVLVPSLSGLKGNLDMCLASRLSTQANLGNMGSSKELMSMVIGNISLVQVQAIVAATVVSAFAIVANSISDRAINVNYILLLTASAVFTATTTCFVLDFVMVLVIYGSHRMNVNPDNVATPLAASIGDIVSNTVLALTAQYMFEQIKISLWQPIILIIVYLCILPIWIYIVYQNKYTRTVLTTGWTPVIAALFISGVGGIVLDQAVDHFRGYEVFQPIVNGIGGNLVCVQSSRLATNLHQTAVPGILPEGTRLLEWPWKTLFFGTPAAKVARMLLILAVTGQIIFMIVADFVYQGAVTIQPAFGLTYVMCSVLQVMVLLYLAYILIHYMWKQKKDPDNAAIPYLTALGDLLGSVFLGLAFVILSLFGMQYGSNVQ